VLGCARRIRLRREDGKSCLEGTKEAMQILKRLGFQTQCGLPYGHLVNYLQVLELTGEKYDSNEAGGGYGGLEQ
jgi:hypothetical protein